MPTSLPPVVDNGTRVLVLGSMPGEMSLRMRQYYAHPQNVFWRIMSDLLGFDASADYAVRVGRLRSAGIGLWDVLRICDRAGSLDSAIVQDSQEANDFEKLFAEHPRIVRVCFNGAKAEQAFRALVAPALRSPVDFRPLPSTSSTNARYSFSAKLQSWRAAVDVS